MQLEKLTPQEEMAMKQLWKLGGCHIRQRHTADVLWSRLLCALCRFNPAAWLMERDLRLLHEYIADASATGSTSDARGYQMALLTLSFPLSATSITNKFNVSFFQKRITMMNCKPTHSLWQAKYLLLISTTALMVAANRPAKAMAESLTSAPQAKEAAAEPTKRQTDIAQVAPTAGKPTPVRDEVATPAVYPGGEAALLKHISQNITYPKAAMEKKIEGLVLVKFNIGTDGAVTDVQVARSLSPECDAEAVRVIKKLEKFRPARDKDGQPVVQKMTLPIRYKIQ